MAGTFNRETIARLRQEYPKGTRVELVSMNDPYPSVKPGDRGTVGYIDDIGTIHVIWDNGSGLGVIYGVDVVRKIDA